MPLVEEIVQELRTSLLDLVVQERTPAFMGRYRLTNQLVNSLSHLVAQDGRYSRLLACSSSGVLKAMLTDSAGSATSTVDSSGNLAVAVRDGATQLTVGNVQTPSGTDNGLAIRDYYGKQVYNLLSGGSAKVQLIDPGGSNVAAVTSNSELTVTASQGGHAAKVGYPSGFGTSDFHLGVSGYDLHKMLTILEDVHDDAEHAIRTIAVS